MRPFSSLLLAVSLLPAATGGLESLPSMYQDVSVLSAANAGFEDGHGWSLQTNWTIDTSVFRSGSQSVKTTSTTNNNINLNFTSAARNYRIRFWVKTDGNPGANAKIYAYVFDTTHGTTAYACGDDDANRLRLSGGLAEWTRYDLCQDVPISRFHYGDTLNLRIYIINNTNAVPVYVDDVELLPDLQPLVVFPLYPNYRGMIWPDQGNAIKWNALVEPPSTESLSNLKVRVQIVRASNLQVMAAVTDDSLEAVNASGPWVHFSVNLMNYDASALADGSYYLRGTLRRISDDSQVYAYPDYKIVKEAAFVSRDGWNVWVDKFNRVRFRKDSESTAKPRFVLGGYYIVSTSALDAPSSTAAGGADCCTAANRTADNHRKLHIGCVKKSFHIENVTNANPARFTVRGHGMVTGNKFTVSGLTGDWATFNGCYYWIGCTHASGPGITVIDANTIEAPINTSSLTSFSGQRLGVLTRDQCKADDKALTSWNRTLGLGASSLVSTMADWGMNTIIRFGNFASANGGTSSSACASYSSGSDDLSGYLAALQDQNIWHLQIVNHYKLGNIPIQSGWGFYDCSSGDNETRQRKAVNLLVTAKPMTNGFMGLYFADEPSNFGLDQWGEDQNIARVWPLTHEYRSLNRGGINFWASTSSSQAYLQWSAIGDASGIDPYPVGAGAVPDDHSLGIASGKKHSRSYAWPRAIADAVFDSRPTWTVPQLWTQASSWPAASDFKIQAVSAIAAGSTGIVWWSLGSTLGSLSLKGQAEFDNFSEAQKKLADLLPILSEPISDLTGRLDGEAEYGRLISAVGHADIKCSSRQRGAQMLLACANTSNAERVNVTITMTGPIQGKVVRAWDGSVITPSGAEFSDTFKGLQDGFSPEKSVHLYLLDTAAASRTRTGGG